ncbi:MAG: esterase-like activity of phytase family protein [Prevotella sp.]|nr:esterase-like activity of phytase family protein [Prevotella sp.]
MVYRRHSIAAALAVIALSLFGPSAEAQQRFHRQMPAGNYSGICPLGDDLYALADDKAETDGFHVVRLLIDADRKRITQVDYQGYRSSLLPNRDMEGICYRPSSRTLFISGEADNEVLEYTLDGQRTGRRLQMPDDIIRRAESNRGLESLTYDATRHLFFTATEHPLPGESHIRLLAFGDDLTLKRQYVYQPDAPLSPKHIYGLSALCALDDGRLLVVERQLRIPRLKLGASALTRIYQVVPSEEEQLQKSLLVEFKTRLTLTGRKFANFEGLCQVSPTLVLLVADSQARYKGVLRDWFRLVQVGE